MKVSKYTKEVLESVIIQSKTWREVCENLGVNANTGSQTNVRRRAQLFGISCEHFQKRANPNIGKMSSQRKDALVHCIYGSTISSHKLKLNLIRDGYKEKCCEECKVSDWYGEELPLELDHVDNNHLNNELSNLKILCPNCHAVKTRKATQEKAARVLNIDIGKSKAKLSSLKREFRREYDGICEFCGKPKKGERYCSEECMVEAKRKNIPIKSELEEIFNIKKSYVQVGKYYGVSDNAVRKWCKKYGIIK